MATRYCPHVFPNYHARFDYPDKTGQIRLFKNMGVDLPHTETFNTVADFYIKYDNPPVSLNFQLPFVFKLSWGGQGDTVFKIRTWPEFADILQKAAKFEASGQNGFMLQKYIPNDHRTLRVVVIGETVIAYWRRQADGEEFHTSLSRGGIIDSESDPDLIGKGCEAVVEFCRNSDINLAGFDIIFSDEPKTSGKPFFLEINYFFGRRGIGGSESYYRLLSAQIDTWIKKIRTNPL